jgi:hypothetical protein
MLDSRGSVVVVDSTTLRKSCDKNTVEAHAPFFPVQKPLHQTAQFLAEQQQTVKLSAQVV